MDFRYYFQHQIVRQCAHRRPVLNVRAKLNIHRGIRHAVAVKYTVFINCLIKEIFRIAEIRINLCRCCQVPFICRSCRDRTRIHQRYRRNLSILQLTSLTVREVSGRVADTKCIVCRRISGAKAWPAECRLYNSSRLHQIRQLSVFRQFYINRRTCRVNAQRKFIRSDTCPFQNIGCRTDIFKSSARASCDYPLVYVKLSIPHLIF